MRALFDVNALIALFTPDHIHGDRIHRWLGLNSKARWASCALTQNGFVRIGSQPAFPSFRPIGDTASMLRTATASYDHQYWTDDLSILDEAIFDHGQIQGPGQLTDAYLLALAAKNGGRLVTFDRRMSIAPVKTAKPENLVILGG